jgi:hypothetical protein
MRYIAIVFTGILTSFFFFPIEFRYLPGINTKMMMAVVGLSIATLQAAFRRDGAVSKDFFVVSIFAAVFSFVSFYSVTYNNTADMSYATYIMSMWVWFFAAYGACYIITFTHGKIDGLLVINYLIGISVSQCILALMIDSIPAVKSIVDTYVQTGVEMMDRIHRLYGIGASLDVAGGKFSAVLIMIAVVMTNYDSIRMNKKYVIIYTSCFVLISVIGAMIARTTYVGTALGLAYIMYRTEIWKRQIKSSNIKFWGMLSGVIFVLVLACIYYYNTDPSFRSWFRFGFEGFVSWIEKGKWETGSTGILQNMVVFPESLKTWIIGDGYMVDPTTGTYYKSTDIGYLRFIFYCGLTGLIVFASMFIYLSISCYNQFSQERHLVLLLLVLVFAIWTKVSTDLFLVYAMFICILLIQKYSNRPIQER